MTFSTDELLALSDTSEDLTYRLELALAALVVESVEGGYRFRHPLVRGTVLRQIPTHERSRGHQRVVEALAGLQRVPPGRWPITTSRRGSRLNRARLARGAGVGGTSRQPARVPGPPLLIRPALTTPRP
jgi:hypothetical protein